jgi:hypothetical protein
VGVALRGTARTTAPAARESFEGSPNDEASRPGKTTLLRVVGRETLLEPSRGQNRRPRRRREWPDGPVRPVKRQPEIGGGADETGGRGGKRRAAACTVWLVEDVVSSRSTTTPRPAPARPPARTRRVTARARRLAPRPSTVAPRRRRAAVTRRRLRARPSSATRVGGVCSEQAEERNAIPPNLP